MPNISTVERLQQTLSMSLEDRSSGYQDLVSNNNVIWHEMRANKMRKPYYGPRIRESLVYTQTGSAIRFSGADYLTPTRTNILNDAEWVPNNLAVNVTLAGDDLLDNSGDARKLDLMATYTEVAEQELIDRHVEDIHSTGAAKDQIAGLQAAIPTDPTTGTYGGLDRANVAIWRTKKFDVDGSDIAAGTQINSTTIQPALLEVCIATSRGRHGPTMFLSSQEHYQAYAAATTAIQRINDDNEYGSLGFTHLKFYGPGRSIKIVLEGGIGSAMPSNVTYGISAKHLCYRYCPEMDFKPIGPDQMPVNQYIVVKNIMARGQMTLTNPLFMSKIFDSDTAS